MKINHIISVVGLTISVAFAPTSGSAEEFKRPEANAAGIVQVAPFLMPFSEFASQEAKKDFIERKAPAVFRNPHLAIADSRKAMDEQVFKPWLVKAKEHYPGVRMEERTIGGVFTQIFTPADGVSRKNARRVLINLHGGGFTHGALIDSQVESIPVASLGRIKVISVDYRMGPEHKFPAASEDVAAVYRELLKTYRPGDIGIYGCSAGGRLSGQAIAWFQKKGLPNPAAIGVFCSSLTKSGMGDSAYYTPRLGGALPAPAGDALAPSAPYMGNWNLDDPIASPIKSISLLQKFPPTLFITGTRSGEMSSAMYSHLALVKAGVDARLFVWDGMDHGFMLDTAFPESREAYDIVVKFFDEKMDAAHR